MPTCTICSHDERPAIDDALVSGQSLRAIARQFGVSKDAAGRHKAHVSHALATLVAEREQAGARSALERFEDLYDDAQAVLRAAKEDGKGSLTLQAIDRLERITTQLAKLSGELDESPKVQVVNLSTSAEWLATRQALMEALAPFPEAAQAVAGRLREIEA